MAGKVITDNKSIEEVGQEIFDLIDVVISTLIDQNLLNDK